MLILFRFPNGFVEGWSFDSLGNEQELSEELGYMCCCSELSSMYLHYVYTSLESSHCPIQFLFLLSECVLWQAFLDATTLSCWIQRSTEEAARGIQFYKENFPRSICSSLSSLPPFSPELIHLILLMQVGYVTTICFSCFLVRCVMVSFFFFINFGDSFCLIFKLSLIIFYCVRCALMHSMKMLTLMSWTIPF